MKDLTVLVVATKAPWPAVDGGRFLLLNTLQALAAAGCRVTLVAPADPDALRSPAGRPRASPRSVPPRWSRRLPCRRSPPCSAPGERRLSIARHTLPAVRREVERRLAAGSFDLVHAEQLQALPQAEPAFARGIPVVLRAQNVENDLWAETARRGRGWRGILLRREARKLAAWEGNAVRRAAATLALTEEDAARLRELAGGEGRVGVVRAAFPDLPPGSGRLAGEPAVTVFGSRGWLPNEESTAWFASEVWPAVRAALPGGRPPPLRSAARAGIAWRRRSPLTGGQRRGLRSGIDPGGPAPHRLRSPHQDPGGLGARRAGGGNPRRPRRLGGPGRPGGSGRPRCRGIRLRDRPAAPGAGARRGAD